MKSYINVRVYSVNEAYSVIDTFAKFGYTFVNGTIPRRVYFNIMDRTSKRKDLWISLFPPNGCDEYIHVAWRAWLEDDEKDVSSQDFLHELPKALAKIIVDKRVYKSAKS